MTTGDGLPSGPRLDDEQFRRLAAYGHVERAEAGQEFANKGRRSAGVARQFSATSGRVENCQVGIYLVYRSGRGHAIVDRRLYLPAEWAEDRQRCRAGGHR